MIILTQVAVELTEEQLAEIKKIADELQITTEEVLRYALIINPEELKLRIVLELLRRKRITVWRAARILGVSFREMEKIMRDYGVEYPISEESVIRELEKIKGSK